METIQKQTSERRQIPYALPKDHRVYAIGDVHGCSALLDALLLDIEKDALSARVQNPDVELILIYLGDLVDRGPDSKATIERILEGPPVEDMKQIVLRGNHERMMQVFLEGDLEMGETWLINGGLETARSYGAQTHSPDLFEIQGNLSRKVPRQHRTLLREMENSVQFGDILFVHAGIDPDKPLDDQSVDDLLWIRGPFLSSDKDFGAYVVHGHSPVNAQDVLDNRANADTGAVYGGWLSCAVMQGQHIQLLQVSDGTSHVRHRTLPL